MAFLSCKLLTQNIIFLELSSYVSFTVQLVNTVIYPFWFCVQTRFTCMILAYAGIHIKILIPFLSSENQIWFCFVFQWFRKTEGRKMLYWKAGTGLPFFFFFKRKQDFYRCVVLKGQQGYKCDLIQCFAAGWTPNSI